MRQSTDILLDLYRLIFNGPESPIQQSGEQEWPFKKTFKRFVKHVHVCHPLPRSNDPDHACLKIDAKDRIYRFYYAR